MVQTSSVVALLYVLDVCAWVIMLGGVAAWQYQCNTSTDASVCLTAAQQLAWWVPAAHSPPWQLCCLSPRGCGCTNDFQGCNRLGARRRGCPQPPPTPLPSCTCNALTTHRLLCCRWAVWFQFFVLIFLFVVYFSRQAISYRVSLMTLLAMVRGPGGGVVYARVPAAHVCRGQVVAACPAAAEAGSQPGLHGLGHSPPASAARHNPAVIPLSAVLWPQVTTLMFTTTNYAFDYIKVRLGMRVGMAGAGHGGGGGRVVAGRCR